MADPASMLTEPLRRLNNRRSDNSEAQLATMSQNRFMAVQLVSMFTLITMVVVTLLSNDQMQQNILHWGQTADCLLNNTSDGPLPKEGDPETPADWAKVLDFLLKLRRQCSRDPPLRPDWCFSPSSTPAWWRACCADYLSVICVYLVK